MIAQETTNLLGDDFMAWVVLALGGALLVGNVLAIVRPPQQREQGELERAPLGRSLVMAVLGGLATVWALATLAT